MNTTKTMNAAQTAQENDEAMAARKEQLTQMLADVDTATERDNERRLELIKPLAEYLRGEGYTLSIECYEWFDSTGGIIDVVSISDEWFDITINENESVFNIDWNCGVLEGTGLDALLSQLKSYADSVNRPNGEELDEPKIAFRLVFM